jgi:hypothetical protein
VCVFARRPRLDRVCRILIRAEAALWAFVADRCRCVGTRLGRRLPAPAASGKFIFIIAADYFAQFFLTFTYIFKEKDQ